VNGGIRGPEIVYELVNASAGGGRIKSQLECRKSEIGSWMHGRGGTVSDDHALGR
jgi:hypothetical protein